MAYGAPSRKYGRGTRWTRKNRLRSKNQRGLKRYVARSRRIKLGNVYRDINRLKRIVNVEFKYLDQNGQSSGECWRLQPSASLAGGANPTVDAPGYISYPILYPAGGDDYNNRDGRMIKLMSIQCKGAASPYAASTSLGMGDFKMYIILDTQAQLGETVDPVPIIWNTDDQGMYSLQSKINKQVLGRFKIICVQNTRIASGQLAGISKFNLYKKLSDHIRFDGTTAADYVNKSFYIVGLADKTMQAYSPDLAVEFSTRLTWVDN